MDHHLYLLIAMSILSASCTKELKHTKEELFIRAFKADPSVTFVLPKSMNDGVNCADYSEGCVAGHTVKIKGLEMIAVEFTTTEEAVYAARKFRGYYSRNWLFDDVTGEPDLEKFVVKYLDAKKP